MPRKNPPDGGTFRKSRSNPDRLDHSVLYPYHRRWLVALQNALAAGIAPDLTSEQLTILESFDLIECAIEAPELTPFGVKVATMQRDLDARKHDNRKAVCNG